MGSWWTAQLEGVLAEQTWESGRPRPDSTQIALVDLRVGSTNGLDVLRLFKTNFEMAVVLLSGYLDARSATEAIRLGADDSLENTEDVKYIVECIERGERPVQPVLDRVLTAEHVEHAHLAKVLAVAAGTNRRPRGGSGSEEQRRSQEH